jgi:hypothetical protein
MRAYTALEIGRAVRKGDSTWLEVQKLDDASGPPLWVDSRLVHVGHHPVGQRIGQTLAPVLGFTSAARHARTFHPDGVVYAGSVSPLVSSGPFAEAAARFEGNALVRMGPGLFRRGQLTWLPDLLSVAIRFTARTDTTPTTTAQPWDQDLLASAETERFPAFLNPLTLYIASEHDYFANTYYAAIPFYLESAKTRVWVRIRPLSFDRRTPRPTNPEAREADLRQAVASGQARFHVEVQRENRLGRALGLDHGWLAALAHPWVPLAELTLTDGPLTLDQEALRFYPELAGRGLVPTGTIAGIRPAVYRASQLARPPSAADRRAEE